MKISVIETADVVTVSVGVATCFPARGGRSEALVRAADENLYRAKEQGRHRVVASLMEPARPGA